jgi:hypothetical protein
VSGTDRRRQALEEVAACVCRDRQDAYADAEDNFARIADLANVVLAKKLAAPLDRKDVALFAACIKLGRLAHDPAHYDSMLDLAGYAVCGAGILLEEREERR